MVCGVIDDRFLADNCDAVRLGWDVLKHVDEVALLEANVTLSLPHIAQMMDRPLQNSEIADVLESYLTP